MKIKEVSQFQWSPNDPVFAAKLVNDYVGFFDLETVRQLVSDARNSIQEQIVDIEYKIGSKRQMAKQRREDQILRFGEALIIARKLAIKDRVDTNTVVQNNQLNISTSNTPLYYRGFKALDAEIVFSKTENQTILSLVVYVIYRSNLLCCVRSKLMNQVCIL